METFDIHALNEQFALSDHLVFSPGPNNLPVARITNRFASAEVTLLGAHVLSFQPQGHKPVLWVSEQSRYEAGKPIRGGIPVCWPWFAVHPTDTDKPMHGFVRTALWTVQSTRMTEHGATQIWFRLQDNASTRALWPHAFELLLVITVGEELHVERIVRNPGHEDFTFSGALHTYFAVSDISNIDIYGLEGCSYLDKTEALQKIQYGPVIFRSETDNVYLETTADCVIDDPGFNRRIHISKTGSRTTVVWNPWNEKAKQIPDFADKGYLSMVCVETANAHHDLIAVHPGEEHHTSASIRVETSEES